MLTLFHISDLHFGPPYVPHVGEALLKAAHTLPFDVIVASGDFTQRAKEEQYREARAFLDALPKKPLIVTPGNHDVPLYRVFERVFSPYELYKKYISAELDSVYQSPQATIVSLNSSRHLTTITNGRVSREQLDFCANAFRESPAGAARIVVAHHHFAPAPDYDHSDAMPKARRALDRFTELKVEMILGGHLHRAYIGNSLDVYSGKDREHGIVIVQSGTSTSRRGRAREREKNSFNLIKIEPDTVDIAHYMYFDDLAGFGPIARHIFPRAGQRYFVQVLDPEDLE